MRDGIDHTGSLTARRARVASAGRVAIGLLLSALGLWLAFRKISWPEFIQQLAAADLRWLAAAVGLLLLTLVVRAFRWQIVLQPILAITAGEAFGYECIGYMVNNLLPLRLGEVARPALLGHRHAVSKVALFGTVVIERLADVVSLLLFAWLALVTSDLSLELRWTAWILPAGLGASIVGLYVLQGREGRVQNWMADRLGQGHSRLLTIASALFLELVAGLETVRSVRRAAAVTGLSLLAWLIGIAQVGLLLAALRLDVAWRIPLMVVVFLNFGSMLPSSPGYVGVAHLAVVLALSLFGVEASRAAAAAVTIHATNFVVTTALGLCYAWREGTSLRSIRRAAAQAEAAASNAGGAGT